MKLSEMREVLAERGIQLTKSLGQNFLHDANQLRRIVELAELNPADNVLEIGPGLGPLTELLLEKVGHVLAIETDARLVAILRERFGNSGLELIHADALQCLRNATGDWGGWKLVSNLPYSVASPILVELAKSSRPPERLVATLQSEVARRLMAGAGTHDYGVLTLLVQVKYQPKELLKIPASCFFPAPDVDSACVYLRRREPSVLPDAEFATFERIVKKSFSQRRKMMMKLLKQDWPGDRLDAAFRELSLSPQCRAETLSLEQFVALTKRLASH